MAKETKQTTQKQRSPFKTVSKNLPFYPDLTNEEQKAFIGCYVSEQILGDKPDPKDNIPVFIFADVETGEEVFITQSYAITKAIEAARREFNNNIKDVVFTFTFKGKTEVHGKPFNQFDTGYCTLEEYNLFMSKE